MHEPLNLSLASFLHIFRDVIKDNKLRCALVEFYRWVSSLPGWL